MPEHTEYQVEYCGMAGSGGKGGKGGQGDSGMVPCQKSYAEQPVGGRVQEKARQAALDAQAPATSGCPQSTSGEQQPTDKSGQPITVYDSDFVVTGYSAADTGTHRVQPRWRVPKWAEAMRAHNATLYQPSDRDPPNRNNYYVYGTTTIDPNGTPGEPLAAPDVHKLRYMSNNYMTPDDWH